MATRLHVRQSEVRSLLDQIAGSAIVDLDTLLASINSELIPPGRLIANSPASLIVNIGSGVISNPGTTRNRSLPQINGFVPAFTGGTITFPAATGGAIVVSPGTGSTLTCPSGQFVKVLVQLDSAGDLSVAVGTAAASAVLAEVPRGNTSYLSLGYIVISNVAGTIQNITNAELYQFDGGGGGGGSAAITTFTFANNQVAPANVTDFLVDPLISQAFSAEMSIRRQNTPGGSGGNDGTPNATFQTNATAAGITGTVYDMAVQSDGSVVIVGDFISYAGNSCNNICRVDSLGVFDSTFNTNIGTGPNGIIICVEIQPTTGQIIIGGQFTSFDGTVRGRLARLNTDGTHDTTFLNSNSGFDNTVRGITFLSVTNNSNIVVGGDFLSFTDETATPVAVNRIIGLSVNGKLSVPGVVFAPVGTAFNSTVRDCLADASDNVYCTGSFANYNGTSRQKIAKLDSTGALLSGWTIFGTQSSPSAVGRKLAIQSDGKLIASGTAYIDPGSPDYYDLWRFDLAGASDSTFNSTILPTGGPSSSGYSLIIQSDGKILIVGTLAGTYGPSNIYRLNSDGTADTTFNTAISTGANGPLLAVALGADNVAYIGGQTFSTFDSVAISDNIVMLGTFASGSSTEYYQQFTIKGIYKPVTLDWDIAYGSAVGVATGVTLTMTSAGQLQYTSSNLAGTINLNEMKFIIWGL